ncbi:WecB/TagA/CpsF family glycosyltransferase [Methylomonas paludis]|uniref:WecB/TagA/CpsF family glycosyltransferase n=1 Tax=Methylomonas paludis TaxID=1173101 RepID=A0A975MLM4_9GAMM|nr:WecB/TagA/CpsF family glycosyltransferase [Methylomonas paludis]QWF69596.1 WecB/TagA/CpsF family glycosyltransferase [Methylomonas paludis]
MNTHKKLVSAFWMLPSFWVYPSLVQASKVMEGKSFNDSLVLRYADNIAFEKPAVSLRTTKTGKATPEIQDILGTKFPIMSYEKLLTIFQGWINAAGSHQVCIANVHTVVTCLTDKNLRSICNNALTTMDGQPLVWYANLINKSAVEGRVCGPDLMEKCLDEGRQQNWKHFFLGGKDYVLNDLLEATRQRFPGVDIVGWNSPPFRALTAEEDQQLVDQINAAKPDFLWVGLGAPKQEKWIAEHLDRINVPVQIGVGAAFAFHSGHVVRAPDWMQKYGLEWLYRMFKERRLVKRYLSTNPTFLLLFARDLLLKRLFRSRSTRA